MFWKIHSKRVEETRKEMTLFVIIELWWDSYTMDWNKKMVLHKQSQGNQYDCWTASAHVFHLSPIREKYVIRVREARVLKNNQEDQAVTKYSYCTRDVRLLPIKDLNVQTQEHQAERMRAKQEEAKQMIEAMERTRGILLVNKRKGQVLLLPQTPLLLFRQVFVHHKKKIRWQREEREVTQTFSWHEPFSLRPVYSRCFLRTGCCVRVIYSWKKLYESRAAAGVLLSAQRFGNWVSCLFSYSRRDGIDTDPNEK